MNWKRQTNTRMFSLLAIFLMLFSLTTPAFAAGDNDVTNSSNKLSNRLMDEFNTSEEVTYLVKFKGKSNPEQIAKEAALKAEAQNLSSYEQKTTLRSAIVSDLKVVSHNSQKRVINYLEAEREKGTVQDIQQYFIVNGLAVTSTADVAKKLATFAEVEKIVPNETRQLIVPEEKDAQLPSADIEDLEWNVEWVRAHEVWEQGIDGKGVVIATIDTGVQWDHPALQEKYRGYNAKTGEVDHNFNWFDATAGITTPYDDNGHGTHVTGTVVGQEPDGSNKIGVAPGAKWIGVKAFTSEGGSDKDLLAAAEWILAPEDEDGNTDFTMAPDIVNNSWGGGPGLNEWYRDVVRAWRSAGIFPVFAAGNVDRNNPGGPESIVAPANYPESFAVGATDIANALGSFSLKGPSPYDEIKPDVVAPGQVIRSSIPANGYNTTSGTSMATPAVSGVIALMKSVNSELTIDEIEDLIRATTVPLTDEEYPETPNNGYGYGLVDAVNAVKAIDVGVGLVTGKVVDQSGTPIDATITLVDEGRSVNSDPSDGSYAISYASGTYTILVEAYGYHTKQMEIDIIKDDSIELDFTLDQKAERVVTGNVIDEYTGEPISSAIALLWEDANIEPVETDANGEFTFDALEGTYTLKVVARDYNSKEISLTIDEELSTIDIQLKPFYSYTDDELAYDDGTAQGSSRFQESGNAWGVRMSLAEGQNKAMVTGGKFYFTRGMDSEFQVEVIAANGPDGAPGDRIAGPFDAKVTEERDWTVVDLRDHGIIVTDDFYLVYHQTADRADAPVIGHDQSSPFNERSWEMYSGYWYQLTPSILTGNKMIRTLVSYEAEQPVITSPSDGQRTNERLINVTGTAKPGTTVQLINNDNVVDTTLVDNDGNFTISVALVTGANVLSAVSYEEDDVIGRSDNVTVHVNTDKPVIENLLPATDQYVVPGNEVEISFESHSENGEASFIVKLPGANKTQSVEGEIMTEVEPGLYKGMWIVPQNTSLNGGIIEVSLIDKYGNETRQDATGKLFVSSDTVDRIKGDSRFDTAVEISKSGWEQANTVILTRNDDYADALAGVPLAHKLDAPILLTRSSYLSPETLEEIKRLEAENVIVLGGTEAVSEEVIAELEAAGLDVERIRGQSRTDTAVEIAKRVSPEGTDKALIVNGWDFPDALSVASQAAINGLPILLTHTDKLSAPTAEGLVELGVTETVVFGGTIAISDDILAELPNAERVNGSNRIETNIAVQEYFNVNTKHMYVATGNEFADSLTGAVLAAKNGSSILLVRNSLTDVTKDYITGSNIERLTLFGGTIAISEDIEAELEKLLK